MADLLSGPLRQHVKDDGSAKKSYPNRGLGSKAAAKANMGRGGGRPYVAYQCEFCGHWHVGRSRA